MAATADPGYAELRISTPLTLLCRGFALTVARRGSPCRSHCGIDRRPRRRCTGPHVRELGWARSAVIAGSVYPNRRHPADGHHCLHDKGPPAANSGAPTESFVVAYRGTVRRAGDAVGQRSGTAVG